MLIFKWCVLHAHRPILDNQMAVIRIADWFLAGGMWYVVCTKGHVEYPSSRGSQRHALSTATCPVLLPFVKGTEQVFQGLALSKSMPLRKRAHFFLAMTILPQQSSVRLSPRGGARVDPSPPSSPFLTRIPSRSLCRPQSRSSLPRAFKSITLFRLLVIPPQGFRFPSCVRVI